MKRILLSLFALLAVSTAVSANTEKQAAPESTVLGKQAAAYRRKAMDYRILSLNALKNADAVRGKTHEAMVAAMTSGKSKAIDEAREKLDDAADDLKDVIESVGDVVERTVRADLLAKEAESLCKAAAAGGKESPVLDVKKVKALLESSSKCLAQAEKISKQLRKDWLEPVLATSSTTSTTTTTKSGPAAGKK